MEIWAWILAYVVGFSLLQVLVYRYFRDSEPSVEGPQPDSGERDRYSRAVDRSDRDRQADDDGIYCQQCGTFNRNEPTYRYCKQCLSPLG